MIHETTWQDIARAYRKVLVEKVIPALVQMYGEQNLTSLTSVIEVIDAEAALLAGSEDEILLEALSPGALFVTRDGIYAVKSEYFYGDGKQCECVLLASGEYAHFPDGNRTPVRAVHL